MIASTTVPLSAEASVYASLLEIVPDATIFVDGTGKIVLANSKAAAMFGWPPADLIGATVEQLIPARFAEAHIHQRQAFFGESRSRPMGIDLPLIGVRADGTEMPLEIALSKFKLGEETVVAASIRDLTLTARYKDSAKRESYSAQLVKLGEFALLAKGMDELLAKVPALIVESLMNDVVIVFWAGQGDELRPRVVHGIAADVQQRLAKVDVPSWPSRQVLADPDARIIEDHRHESGVDSWVARELGLRTSIRIPLVNTGMPIGLLAAYARTPNAFGPQELHFLQAIGNVIIASFLRVEIEERFLHATRIDAIGQLTGGVAHDFNNILTVVLGNLQMLRESLTQDRDAARLKLLSAAQRAAKRGALLTNKLLTFSRKQLLAPRPVDLETALRSMCEMLQRTLGETIQVEWFVTPGCPRCIADPLQLDNAILNLALNARDAMPRGGRLRIAASPTTADEEMAEGAGELAPGDYVAISVVDSGQGMKPDVLKRACEPFYTTKQSGQGTGLGLSIVYGFTRQSGGSLRIDSAPGVGTTICMYFPAAETELAATAGSNSIVDNIPVIHAIAETVLVVDDDAELLNFAEECLATRGFRVLRATSIAEAMQRLSDNRSISLLFTDVMLAGGETGPLLVAEAQKLRPGLPVLYTSGSRLSPRDATEVRPAQFLPKPYEREELILRVETLLLMARAEFLLSETQRRAH